MIHAFNIYPAWFILTPIMQEQSIQTSNHSFSNEKADSNECRENPGNWPQTFWGDCLFNENHTQLVLRFESGINTQTAQKLLDANLPALEPVKYKGERYAMTFVPVLN